MKVTKKSVLGLLASAVAVEAKMVGGVAIEDWPELVSDIKHVHKDAKESDDKIEFNFRPGQSSYRLKPKIARVRKGSFQANSTSYTFMWDGQASSGHVKDLKVLEDGSGLELTMFNGARMQYRPVAQAA